jgi:hypothetical protein
LASRVNFRKLIKLRNEQLNEYLQTTVKTTRRSKKKRGEHTGKGGMGIRREA